MNVLVNMFRPLRMKGGKPVKWTEMARSVLNVGIALGMGWMQQRSPMRTDEENEPSASSVHKLEPVSLRLMG